MTDKELKDWCKTCDVEPPAMRFKCPECEHNPDKEQIVIDGVDISGCEFIDEWKHCDICNSLIKTVYPNSTKCLTEQDLRCETYQNCHYKQLARKTQECEELLKENQQLRNSLSDSLMFKFTGQENETNRYLEALEIIEGMLQVIVESNKVYPLQSNLYKILDIINKAKGEEDEKI